MPLPGFNLLINRLKPGNEAALLGGQGQGCWGGFLSSKRWGGRGRERREEKVLVRSNLSLHLPVPLSIDTHTPFKMDGKRGAS